MVIAILGILAAISIPNFTRYRAMAERANVLITLKYLMDGEDLYFTENDEYFPSKGTLKIPEGKAVEIPELAYNFPEGHKNSYRIKGTHNKNFTRYEITVSCNFDSNGNGKKDRFDAKTEIKKGNVTHNREVVQTQ
jgi:Tfp pilus assembly protein PilE